MGRAGLSFASILGRLPFALDHEHLFVHHALCQVDLAAGLKFMSEVSRVGALLVIDAPQPRHEEVLLIEVAELVVEIIFVQALHQH